jgi:hypothetical protein
VIDTLDDVDPPYREGDSDKVVREVTWPGVDDAMRRITILIGDQAETDIAARDLIVVMREIGRLTAENAELKSLMIVKQSNANE